MIRRIVYITTFLLLIIITSTLFGSDLKKGTASSFNLIESDYKNGIISLDEKALLQIQALKNQNLLPDKYKSEPASTIISDLRGGTVVLIDIKQNWDKLSEETQDKISQSLSRVATAFTYDSPSGFFKLHYDTTGTNKVPSEDLDSDDIPDFIEKCAAYCDSSLQKHLDLDYLVPPPDNGLGGDDMYDIYFEESYLYGYTVPEAGGEMPWNDVYSYFVLNSDFIGFPPNADPEGQVEGAAKVTIAHEFHHAVQFAYDFNEGSWYMELDATYMEDIVFDHVDDNYNYLDGFFNYPQTSLMDNGINHKYASFIWNIYLAEKYDTSLMTAVWEGARYTTVFNTLTDTIFERYNITIDSAFTVFTFWNFLTSVRDDGQHYQEGTQYPLISIGQEHFTYPVNLQNSPSSVSGYGCNYVTFYPGTLHGNLEINFNGSDTREWSAYIIKSTAINQHEIEYVVLEPEVYEGTVKVDSFENYFSVTLVGVNLSEFFDGALFTYSADLKLPYDVSTELLTEDTLLYSGSTRNYDYKVINTSGENDVYYIIYWDDLDWLPLDTLEQAISPGDSIIFSIPVSPPAGTPIDLISNVYFKTVSWGNPEVSENKSLTIKSVLQRGDLDSSGEVDISDIVYFVEFSFLDGPFPLPDIFSADFDCSDEVDIEDLVRFVEYSFDNGPPCPCNPY